MSTTTAAAIVRYVAAALYDNLDVCRPGVVRKALTLLMPLSLVFDLGGICLLFSDRQVGPGLGVG